MRLPKSLTALLIAPALLLAAGNTPSSVIVDDTFAAANSQLQDIAHNSLWLFNGRSTSVRTDAPGSVSFDLTPTSTNSEGFWAYFTPSGTPIKLGVGDTLSVTVTFSVSGFKNNGQDIRWGVLNSLGTRNTANLTGGMNDSTFVNDTGYGLDYFASGSGSPFVIARRTTLSTANVFNSFGDFTAIPGSGANARQAIVDGVPYTLTYTIKRLTATTTQISSSVTGGSLAGLDYTAVESSTSPNTAFDYFAFRIGGTNFSTGIAFSELKVQYLPAAPVIFSQPQPSSLTLQVGGSVSVSVGATGNALLYQWQKDGQPLTGNDSASTATLTLSNVQHADAGKYTAVITNAGGSATSDAVTLKVSDTPVPPAPSILVQPSATTVTAGQYTSLFVAAAGDNLIYQWFKNGQLISGATDLQLKFPSAQAADAASYSVVVANSSGSIQSKPAAVLVVSSMHATSFGPANWAAGVCNDTSLFVNFDQPPVAGTSGRIQVVNSKGAVVDVIDMSSSPQSKTIGGTTFAYVPVLVSGNTATILLHQSLPFNDYYYVTMDPGVITDASGAPFNGIAAGDLWAFQTRAAAPQPGTASLAVAADGSGDFCTVQSAIDFVPAGNTKPVTITVAPGNYNEIVYVNSQKPFLTVRGADRNLTVIQYPNNNSLNPSTTGRPTFGVDAPDFTLENLTVWNTTPKGGSQAEAFRGNNARILLNRVNLKSYQDTLLLQGGGFVTDSYIEGDVDFMWGTGPVFIQNSELKALSSSGYYTQIRNGQGQFGFVYVNNRLTGATGVTGMYLGRIDPTVFPYSQVVYINNAMGPDVAPVGWLLNNATTAPNVQFEEYRSTDLNGAPLDVSQRATFSRQLTAAQAAQLSDPANVLAGWVPYTLNAASPAIADWSAPAGHSAQDWIGLFVAGADDANPVSRQFTGAATTGRTTFTPPAPGTYEFRMFVNNGTTRAAVSTPFAVTQQ